MQSNIGSIFVTYRRASFISGNSFQELVTLSKKKHLLVSEHPTPALQPSPVPPQIVILPSIICIINHRIRNSYIWAEDKPGLFWQ